MTAEEAAALEQQIADEAAEIRADEKELSPGLFMQLWPLLLRPIPEAYLVTTPRTQGKPYESTGIKSVQVQIDRLNAVLTPLWWWDDATYEEAGRLCRATVWVGEYADRGKPDRILVTRSSWGGVERGSGLGNLYKGSYTNAMKLAIARLGPGHEVYVGATDLDPDVEPSASGPTGEIGEELAGALWTRANQLGLKERLQLAASHVVERDVGDCKTKAKAVAALSGLTFAQSERLENWLSRKADEQAANEGGSK